MSTTQCRRLEGKVAVVTASTAGIGLAIAERLGQEGAHVVVSSRKQAQVDTAVHRLKQQGLSVEGTVCHVAKKEDRQRLLQKVDEHFGGIDILVSNAAVNPVSVPMFGIFEVNVKATFFLCKEALPYIEKKGGGSIIIVGSYAGFNAREMAAVYGVSKTTLLGLCKAMAKALAPKNIRVNAIAPGLIKTHFSQSLWDNADNPFIANIPLQRIGMPEECAGAVAYLSSDDASYVTGETIVISGGTPSRL